MSTPTSTRLQKHPRSGPALRVIVLPVIVVPVIAALSLVGAAAASADSPASVLTVGVPNVKADSGVVYNRLAAGPTQLIDEVGFDVIGRREPGARFGAAILSGHDLDTNLRNYRGEEDLIIGAPGTPGTQTKDVPGRVVMFFGSRKGFRPSSTLVLENHAEPGDEFGAALALRYREVANTRIRDLWVGAPGHDVDGKVDAGAVYRYEISATGVPTYIETITQDNPRLDSEAEAGDRFGEVLAGDGVVGVPHEDVGALKDAGAVQYLSVDDDSGELIDTPTYVQGKGHFKDEPEAGDRFGAAVWGNAIGIPGEDVGTVKDAGAVQMGDGLIYHQDTPGIPGKAEAGDRFGAALSIGSGLQQRSGSAAECSGMSSVAVGIPGEDIGTVKDAGSIMMMPSGFRPPNLEPGIEYCRPQMFAQGHGLPGKAEAGDQVGAAMGVRARDPEQASAARDTVLIGVPGEDIAKIRDVGRVIHGTGASAKVYGYSGGNVSRMRFGTVLPSGNRIP
jgi:hypothetical protein